MASGLGIGGGAGVGVAVSAPGSGRGWLGVAGCGRSPLLAEGLVGPPLCPRGVSGGPAAPLAGGCWVLVLWVFVCCMRLWCGWCSRFGVCCAFVGLVSLAVVAVCVVCMRGRVCGVLVVRLGACPRLSGLRLAALCGCGGCVSWPLSRLGCGVWVWFPAPPGWGLLVLCPPAAPFACPPPPVSLPRRLGRCSRGAVPGRSWLWWVGGGPCCRLRSLPLVFPLGGGDACTPRQGVTLLYGPSICTRSVQMDLLRSQALQPFPTPGSGTLWVAGESLRDGRVSCLPRWMVCPTRSPSLGPNRSTCRGECSWSGPLVTAPGWCHHGPLTNGPGRIPPYCVCSGGADTVTGGPPKNPEVGSLACVSRGPFSSRPPLRCVICGGGFSVSSGWGGGGGGRFSLFLAVLLVCVSPPPLVVVPRRCVCLWRGACARGVCVSVCVVRLCWRGCGCVFRVCWCVCVRVWVCGWGRLGLAAGLGVGVVGVCRGRSLPTPGGGS